MNKTENTVHLRPARPEYNEGLIFARFIDQAAEGFFRFLLGKNSETIIATAFLELNHSLSYEHVVFVEKDQSIVGMSSTFTGVQNRKFSNEPLHTAASSNAIRMKFFRILLAPLWRVLETIPEGDFYIQSIAVESNLRGAGIGSRLMNDIEKRAIESGSKRLSLDVSAKNEGAKRLYKRLEMREVSEWPSSRLLPTIFVRMAKDL